MHLIIGASSGVGLKLALLSAYSRYDLILVSSDKNDLVNIKSHIENVYSVKVYIFNMNLANIEASIETYSKNIKYLISSVSKVFFIAGKNYVNDPNLSLDHFESILRINYSSIAYLFILLLKDLPEKSFVIFASTIACIRARSSNTAYASAKNSLEFFVKGIRHSYPKRSQYFKIVRFGYLDSQMTFGQTLLLPKISTFKAAKYLFDLKRSSSFISYFPRWWFLFNFIKFIPFYLFKFFRF